VPSVHWAVFTQPLYVMYMSFASDLNSGDALILSITATAHAAAAAH
jgi:hypothetical protein